MPKSIYVMCMIIWVEMILYVGIVFIALSSMNFHSNFYLEKITIESKASLIIVQGPKINVVFALEELEQIKNFFPQEVSYFRGTFEEWCTLTFVTKQGSEYPWGFRLSEKKGNEVKQELENWIKKHKKKERKE